MPWTGLQNPFQPAADTITLANIPSHKQRAHRQSNACHDISCLSCNVVTNIRCRFMRQARQANQPTFASTTSVPAFWIRSIRAFAFASGKCIRGWDCAIAHNIGIATCQRTSQAMRLVAREVQIKQQAAWRLNCGMLTYLGQKRQNCDTCMATYDRHIHLRGINFQNLAHKCIGSRHIQLGHSKQLSRVEYASPVRTAVLWHVMFYPQ